MSGSTAIAKVISRVMNPFPLTLIVLLMVTYAGSPNLGIFARWAMVILLSFIIVPIAYVYVKNALAGNKGNSVQDPTAFFRAHRSQIWIIEVIAAGLFLPLMVFFDAPSLISATFVTVVGTSLFIALINKYHKASFHLATVTALIIVAILVWGKALLPVLIVIPLVGWARYALRQHSPYQLASGFGLALIVTSASFYYFGLLGNVAGLGI